MKSSKVNEINDAVADILSKGRNDEKIFTLGIELGKAIATKEIEFERLPFFVQKELKLEADERLRHKKADIAGLIDRLFYLACLKQMKMNGSITFEGDSGYVDLVKVFEDEVGEEFFVRFENIQQEDEEQDYKIQFDLIGEVAEIFEKFNARTHLSLSVSNLNYTTNLVINHAEDLRGSLRSVSFGFNSDAALNDEVLLNDLFTELDKATLMLRLKYSAD